MSAASTYFRLRAMRPILTLGCACAVALVLARPASAALGETAASIAKDKVAMRGTQQITPMQSYDVHRLVDPTGGVVHEYADRAGNVFAVTWHGQHSPDLKSLLGAYYGRYVAAASLHRTGHHLVTIHAPDLVLSVVHFQRSVYG
ncbi:MAG TPA: DUF2844 domain-containing protein, partial [Steroidobacteraceae bacterium]|nr:DUF2844 domain-containing protein [Steroidobacteraceae bacterium]